VRRKWIHNQQRKGGSPRTDKELERLGVRLAKENGWGDGKLEGELLKVGYEISDETIRRILSKLGIPPSPERDPSLS
jgi:putative transposase